MRRRFAPLAVAVLASTVAAPPTRATTVPAGFVHEVLVGEPFVSSPVGFCFLPDGRFVLVEQESGVVRIAAVGVASSDSIFTLPDVRTDHPERGLLGVAADPAWPARPYLYLHYTATDSTVKIVMVEASGDLAVPTGTAVTLANPFVLLDAIDDDDGIHNAGTLRFAPDGTLWVSVGDDAKACQAQDSTSVLGKLLRLDVSAMPGPGPGPPPVADLAPADNPFAAAAGFGPLVRAWGLRNPFRFTVDDPTGDVFLGSVGSHLFEEINLVPALPGAPNFGWPQVEGFEPIFCCGDCGDDNPFTDPIHVVPHPAGVISVIGGPRLRHVPASPVGFPASYDGDVLFAEIFSGNLTRLRESGGAWAVAPDAPGQPAPGVWGGGFVGASDLQLGDDGAVYVLSRGLSA
ncbi:PQQ-dependent sugar dehydrogenase, partial [bacterium]|nr:PQQ-dependent sugar dehydrogenase [bacterium]